MTTALLLVGTLVLAFGMIAYWVACDRRERQRVAWRRALAETSTPPQKRLRSLIEDPRRPLAEIVEAAEALAIAEAGIKTEPVEERKFRPMVDRSADFYCMICHSFSEDSARHVHMFA